MSDFLHLFPIIILPCRSIQPGSHRGETTLTIIAGVVLCHSPIPFRSFMLPLHGESNAGLGAASSLYCWTVIMGRPTRLPACAQLMYYPTWGRNQQITFSLCGPDATHRTLANKVPVPRHHGTHLQRSCVRTSTGSAALQICSVAAPEVRILPQQIHKADMFAGCRSAVHQFQAKSVRRRSSETGSRTLSLIHCLFVVV